MKGKGCSSHFIPWRGHPLALVLHTTRCKAGIGNAQCLHKRQCEHRLWHVAGLGAGTTTSGGRYLWEAVSCLRACPLWERASVSAVRFSAGMAPLRVLTSGIKTCLISCAFLYSLQYEIWRFLDCYNSQVAFFFLLNFCICVRPCLGTNQIWKTNTNNAETNGNEACVLKNSCIYFGNLFLLFLLPVPIWT